MTTLSRDASAAHLLLDLTALSVKEHTLHIQDGRLYLIVISAPSKKMPPHVVGYAKKSFKYLKRIFFKSKICFKNIK